MFKNTDLPSTLTFPILGVCNPEIISNKVLFPDPLSPTIHLIPLVYTYI